MCSESPVLFIHDEATVVECDSMYSSPMTGPGVIAIDMLIEDVLFVYDEPTAVVILSSP